MWLSNLNRNWQLDTKILIDINNQLDTKIKVLQTTRGREYLYDQFKSSVKKRELIDKYLFLTGHNKIVLLYEGIKPF